MAQDFGHTKRRIQEAKKKKREEKRLKKMNKDVTPPALDPNANTFPGEGEAAAG